MEKFKKLFGLGMFVIFLSPLTASAAWLSVSWSDASPEATTYEIHYGLTSGSRTFSTTVGIVQIINGRVFATISGLNEATTYYFQYTAINAEGNDSDWSNEIVYTTGVDEDGDGLTQSQEAALGLDFESSDSNDNGIDDGDEYLFYGSAWDQDFDGDGVVNLLDADADGDGDLDGDEINSYGGDPLDSEVVLPAEQILITASEFELRGAMEFLTENSSEWVETPAGTTVNGYADIEFSPNVPGDYVIWALVEGFDKYTDSFIVYVDDQPGHQWWIPQRQAWVMITNDSAHTGVVEYNFDITPKEISVKQRERGARLYGIVLTEKKDLVPNSVFGADAEDFSLRGSMEERSEDDLTWIESPPEATVNGYADISFTIEKEGTYAIWGDTEGLDKYSDSFIIYVDELAGHRWYVPQKRIWNQVKNDSAGTGQVFYSFTAGEHTVSMKQRERGTRLYRIAIQKVE